MSNETLPTVATPNYTGDVKITELTVGSTVISEADIKRIDGGTNGTATADKALVPDSSLNIAGLNKLSLANLVPNMTTVQRLAVTPAEGMVTYDTNLKTLYVYSNSSWKTVSSGSSVSSFDPTVPKYDFSNYTFDGLNSYLTTIQFSTPSPTYNAYSALSTGSYNGGVYSPTQNRIYLVPYDQADQANWHYINCADGSVNAYAHGVTAVNLAYYGGVYSPTQNRIYLVPDLQAAQANWHYIDCSDGSVVAYAHGATVLIAAYYGGVYSPTQNRIYLVPANQSQEANWHYIDCSDGSVVAYANTKVSEIPVGLAYQGGVYSPTQNRIYFVPLNQHSATYWHYIDCSDGSIGSYAKIITDNLYYAGGAYSPTQNRIYLAPHGASSNPNWHYIDCADGSVVSYTHGITAVDVAYRGCVYSPTQNRIYLVPYDQSLETNWHYIDCNDGSVVAYAHGLTITGLNKAYSGGVFSPTQNRIYFVPYFQGAIGTWHYIGDVETTQTSKLLMSNALFNKF